MDDLSDAQLIFYYEQAKTMLEEFGHHIKLNNLYITVTINEGTKAKTVHNFTTAQELFAYARGIHDHRAWCKEMDLVT